MNNIDYKLIIEAQIKDTNNVLNQLTLDEKKIVRSRLDAEIDKMTANLSAIDKMKLQQMMSKLNV